MLALDVEHSLGQALWLQMDLSVDPDCCMGEFA